MNIQLQKNINIGKEKEKQQHANGEHNYAAKHRRRSLPY